MLSFFVISFRIDVISQEECFDGASVLFQERMALEFGGKVAEDGIQGIVDDLRALFGEDFDVGVVDLRRGKEGIGSMRESKSHSKDIYRWNDGQRTFPK